MVLLFYTTYINVDLAHLEKFYSKVGKGGINLYKVSITWISIYIFVYNDSHVSVNPQ